MSVAQVEQHPVAPESAAPSARAGDAWPWLALVLGIGWLVRLAYLWLRPPSAVSVDAVHWAYVTQLLLAGRNPYAETSYLNWPPLWPQCLYALGRIAEATGVHFFTLLWLLLIAVESLLIVATWRLMRELVPGTVAAAAQRGCAIALLLSVALNPAAVALVCQHGNFDVLMTLWVVLFLISLIRYARDGDRIDWLIACGWLGLAVLTKTVPIVLAPLLAIGVASLPRRVRTLGVALVLGPAALAISVIYVLAPAGVWQNVIRYRSFPGWYGLTGLLLIAGRDDLAAANATLFALAVPAAMAITAVMLWRRGLDEPRRIVLIAALVMLAIPTFGPGYGPQYLYWFLPLLAACYVAYPLRWWRRLLVCALVVVAATYVVEYGLFPTHGAMFVARWPDDAGIARASRTWSDRAGQTIVRLPLFATCIGVLIGGVRLLRREPNLSQPSSVEGSGRS